MTTEHYRLLAIKLQFVGAEVATLTKRESNILRILNEEGPGRAHLMDDGKGAIVDGGQSGVLQKKFKCTFKQTDDPDLERKYRNLLTLEDIQKEGAPDSLLNRLDNITVGETISFGEICEFRRES